MLFSCSFRFPFFALQNIDQSQGKWKEPAQNIVISSSHWLVILSLPTVFENTQVLPRGIPKSKAPVALVCKWWLCCTASKLFGPVKKIVFLHFFFKTPLELRMCHFWGMLSLFSCTGAVFYSQNLSKMIFRRFFFETEWHKSIYTQTLYLKSLEEIYQRWPST